MVLPRDVFHPWAFDVEDRHPPPVDASHLDAGELAASSEPEGPEEEVLGLKHRRLPWSRHSWTAGGESAKVGRVEVSPSLL